MSFSWQSQLVYLVACLHIMHASHNITGAFVFLKKCVHAVAHVREEGCGRWWRFDDGEVKIMPNGPLGEHGDHGVQSAATKEKRVSSCWLLSRRADSMLLSFSQMFALFCNVCEHASKCA